MLLSFCVESRLFSSKSFYFLFILCKMNASKFTNVEGEYVIMEKTYPLLRTLGVRATYQGYYYTAYAVSLVLEDRTYLLSVTKRLYPDIASHFHTNAACVEHSIRTVLTHLWEHGNREYLNELAQCRLDDKPVSSEFIDILATHLMLEQPS